MNPRTLEHGWRRTFLLGALVLSALALRPQPLLSQANTCTLVKASDGASLLGGSATQKPTPGGMACTWSSADGKRKVAVLAYKNQGVPPEAAYMGARRGVQAGGGTRK